VVLYTLYELVENYDAHPQFVDNINFYIVPVANPDGYVYTWIDDVSNAICFGLGKRSHRWPTFGLYLESL